MKEWNSEKRENYALAYVVCFFVAGGLGFLFNWLFFCCCCVFGFLKFYYYYFFCSTVIFSLRCDWYSEWVGLAERQEI